MWHCLVYIVIDLCLGREGRGRDKTVFVFGSNHPPSSFSPSTNVLEFPTTRSGPRVMANCYKKREEGGKLKKQKNKCFVFFTNKKTPQPTRANPPRCRFQCRRMYYYAYLSAVIGCFGKSPPVGKRRRELRTGTDRRDGKWKRSRRLAPVPSRAWQANNKKKRKIGILTGSHCVFVNWVPLGDRGCPSVSKDGGESCRQHEGFLEIWPFRFTHGSSAQ